MPVGRLTRAAVFSWALVGAAGCSGDDEILVDAAFTGTDSSVVVADAAPSPDAETPDAGPAADAAPTDAEAADASTVPDAMVPLPYGAPPARGRLV